MRKLMCAMAVIAMAAAPALAVTFTENFDAGWSTSGNWTKEGVTSDTYVPMAEFGVGDGRLVNNTSASGGLSYDHVAGDADIYPGGNNEEIYIDYTMAVPNGTYTFNISLDVQMNWPGPNGPNDWAMAYCTYIGDAAEMDYGTQLYHNAPSGPWIGYSWGGPNAAETALSGTKWAKSQIPVGEWQSVSYSETNDAVNTIDVTSGEVVFRMAVRNGNVNANQAGRAWAMDNLVIELVPEPASIALLAFGMPLLRRRRRA